VIYYKSFQNIFIIFKLYRVLAETNKSHYYHLIDRLICFILILPVFTTTIDLIFSAMKHVKTVLLNKMKEEFLADFMMIYIERKLVEDINSDSIINELYSIKYQMVQL
jgi:hypothetical protein